MSRRSAYLSLALSYKTAVDELERNLGMFYDKIYIVGGGAKNQFLNRLTAYFTKKRVIALPIKAKWFVLGYGLIELFSGIRNSVGDNTAHFAHLGGMIFGFILIKYWQKHGSNL